MPTNPSDGRRGPSYMPFFSVDQQSGALGLNSAGSVANAKLEQLLRDRESPRNAPLPDSKIYKNRQRIVDEYYHSQKHGDRVRHGGVVVELAKIASPLKVPHDLYQASEQTARERKNQLAQVRNSYFDGQFKMVYEEIDNAVKESQLIRDEIMAKKPGVQIKKAFGSQKNSWDFDFSSKEQEKIDAPMHEYVKTVNKVLKDENVLMRLRWRTYLRDDGHRAVNLFFIFPSTASEVREGPSSWIGMKNSHSRDA